MAESSKSNDSDSPVPFRGRTDSVLSFTCLPANLEEKILDTTGPIQLKANLLRSQPPVNWQPYLNAGLISKTDFTFLSAFQETETKEERDELLNYFKDDAFLTLITVVQNVCVVEEIQKFLIMIDDMLWEDISRITRYRLGQAEPWKAFMDLLHCGDNFVCSISSRIIAKFICAEGCKPSDIDLRIYLTWLKSQLQSDNKYLLSICRCLQRILKHDEYRLHFYSMNGIFRIIRLLSFGTKPQAQYQLVFCLWVASFNPVISQNLNRFSAIPVLVELLESCPAEMIKLPRVVIATFRNLLEKPQLERLRKHNALVMIQCKLLKLMESFNNRYKNIQDEEIEEDYQVVEDILRKYEAELSTFDEYKLEVRSGRLEWSVVHTCKRFWHENAARLNDKKYELLKILISLLETSDDATALCVAAHDLGEYMRHYSRGKKVIDELGGKDVLLGLLTNMHPMVKYHALRSLQILMLNNYDLLIEYSTDPKTADKIKDWKKNKLLREENNDMKK